MRAEPAVGLLVAERGRALEAVGDPAHRDDGPRPGRVDVQPEPLPGRDLPERRRARLDPDLALDAGAGRALAVPVHQPAEPRERLLAGDLLLDDRRDQRLHDQAAAAEARVLVATPGLLEDRMSRLEARPVVEGTQQAGHRLERPLRALAPGLGVHVAVRVQRVDDQRGRPLGGADPAPDPAAFVDAERRVAAAVALLVEGADHRAGPVGAPHPHLSTRHEVDPTARRPTTTFPP